MGVIWTVPHWRQSADAGQGQGVCSLSMLLVLGEAAGCQKDSWFLERLRRGREIMMG